MIIRELINLIGFKVDDKQLKDTNSKFAKLKSMAKTAALALGAAIVGIGTAALKTAIDMESLTAQFEVMLGSAEKAEKMVEKLTDFAASTPFALQDLANGTKNLLAFGVESENVIDVMRMLGDTAGGNAQKLETVVRAYGKIQAKGKGTLEELNMITEAGIPILDTLSKNLGITTEEFLNMKGGVKVTKEEIVKAFETMTGEGGVFYQGMLKASTTTAGLFSTLKDNFVLALGNAAKEALPAIKDLMTKLIPIVSGEFSKLVKSMVSILIPILDTIINLLQPIMNLLLTVFKVLVPLLNIVANIINKTLIPIIYDLLEILTPMLEDLGLILVDVMTMLEPLLNIIFHVLSMMIKQLLTPMRVLFLFLKPYIRLLSVIMTPLLTAFSKIYEIMDALTGLTQNLFVEVMGKAIDWILNKLGSLGDGLRSMFSGIGDFFANIINSVIDGINFLIKATNKVAKTKIELIDRIDPTKSLTKNITNNNQKQQNINIQNDINVNGMKNTEQVKQTIEKTAGSVFNMELKKLLMSSGGF